MLGDEFHSLRTPRCRYAEGRVTILVIEDDEDTRALAASALRYDGFTVRDAGHPQEAIQILKTEGLDIDIVIIDILLPELNGDELARKILIAHPFLKIIFASAMTIEEVESRVNGVPFQCFLQKPFGLEDLREAVRLTMNHFSLLR